MATDVPQRELRNRTADLLRRVEAGERLRITVHGHPVAELVPIEDDYPRRFVPMKKFEELAGILTPEQGRAWIKEIREIRDESPARDPFEKYEEQRRERRERDARGDR
jgi:prevent-host-death family protein